MNQDDSTYEIPDYILSRLQPTLKIEFPGKRDEMAILQYHLPFADQEMLMLTVEFLQQSHQLKLDFSPRDGINLLRFAMKRLQQRPDHPVHKDQVWREALLRCLGDEALDLDSLAQKQQRALGGEAVPMGLGDFYFDQEDPLHPDADDEQESDSELESDLDSDLDDLWGSEPDDDNGDDQEEEDDRR